MKTVLLPLLLILVAPCWVSCNRQNTSVDEAAALVADANKEALVEAGIDGSISAAQFSLKLKKENYAQQLEYCRQDSERALEIEKRKGEQIERPTQSEVDSQRKAEEAAKEVAAVEDRIKLLELEKEQSRQRQIDLRSQATQAGLKND